MTFVGGKGGVGKTTVAAAAALASAESGHRTLLVSTDPAHSTADILGATLGDEAREVQPRLFALEIDPAREADRYIATVRQTIADVTPPRMAAEVERQIDAARVSPGAEEAALFDRFARLLASAGATYDRICFDTAPLGHTLRLLALPEQMGDWMQTLISRRRQLGALGRMWKRVAGTVPAERPEDEDPVLAALEARRARFRAVRTTLTDPARAAFVFVLVPERLPILETARAIETLRRARIPVAGIVVNRVLPTAADGAFLAARREQEGRYLQEIDERFAALPRHRLPLLERDVDGPAALRRLAERLAPALH